MVVSALGVNECLDSASAGKLVLRGPNLSRVNAM